MQTGPGRFGSVSFRHGLAVNPVSSGSFGIGEAKHCMSIMSAMMRLALCCGASAPPASSKPTCPFSAVEVHSFLDIKVARRFLVNRGYETVEPLNHEDRAKQPIHASNIRRVIRHPEPKFRRNAENIQQT